MRNLIFYFSVGVAVLMLSVSVAIAQEGSQWYHCNSSTNGQFTRLNANGNVVCKSETLDPLEDFEVNEYPYVRLKTIRLSIDVYCHRDYVPFWINLEAIKVTKKKVGQWRPWGKTYRMKTKELHIQQEDCANVPFRHSALRFFKRYTYDPRNGWDEEIRPIAEGVTSILASRRQSTLKVEMIVGDGNRFIHRNNQKLWIMGDLDFDWEMVAPEPSASSSGSYYTGQSDHYDTASSGSYYSGSDHSSISYHTAESEAYYMPNNDDHSYNSDGEHRNLNNSSMVEWLDNYWNGN